MQIKLFHAIIRLIIINHVCYGVTIMSRLASVIFCSCLFAVIGALAAPTEAANGADRVRRAAQVKPAGAGSVWYSTSCCYRKVVKHVRGEAKVVAYIRMPEPAAPAAARLDVLPRPAPHRVKPLLAGEPPRPAVRARVVDNDRCRARPVPVNDGRGTLIVVVVRCQ
jgi:hypothetical protein